MTIREYLKKLGATENELGAKVVQRMEQAMLVDADLSQFRVDTVVKIIADAASGLASANGNTKSNIAAAERITAELKGNIADAEAHIEDLRQQTKGIKDAKIKSLETKDAVMAYAAVLNATREIFGDANLSADVMVAAINAGSYIAWRGIMGPKDPEFKPNRLR